MLNFQLAMHTGDQPKVLLTPCWIRGLKKERYGSQAYANL
jgi:hypothetical protein